MKGYKGFDKDLKCRNFQYEVGNEYEEKEAHLCINGFHACENPFDVFSYYPPSNSRYCEVDVDDNGERNNEDSKICGKRIRVETEIGLNGLIKAGVKFILDKVDFKNANNTNTGYMSAATNTGRYSAATNMGDNSAATNTGDNSAATNTGYMSAATNTGYMSAATNTGDNSAATNTGDNSAATNTGYMSAAEVNGNGSVAIVTGYKSKVKASLGNAIVIVERGKWNGKIYPLLAIKSAIVDGKIIKEDTWYKLVDGEFVEADEND